MILKQYFNLRHSECVSFTLKGKTSASSVILLSMLPFNLEWINIIEPEYGHVTYCCWPRGHGFNKTAEWRNPQSPTGPEGFDISTIRPQASGLSGTSPGTYSPREGSRACSTDRWPETTSPPQDYVLWLAVNKYLYLSVANKRTAAMWTLVTLTMTWQNAEYIHNLVPSDFFTTQGRKQINDISSSEHWK